MASAWLASTGAVFWTKVQTFVYGPADATVTPISLASLKSRLVYLSSVSLPRLPPDTALAIGRMLLLHMTK